MSFDLRRSCAVRVLVGALESGLIDRARLARALRITEATLDSMLTATVAIPLDRQLQLALLVIERAPAGSALARLAHRLRAQSAAAMTFRMQETPRHLTAPVLPYR
jgi:phage gp36-like protein